MRTKLAMNEPTFELPAHCSATVGTRRASAVGTDTPRPGPPETEPRETVVCVSEVSKQYAAGNDEIAALCKTDLAVESGEFISIVGPSGCGKTTLLKLIGGLIPPTSGEISVHGKTIDGPSDKIGFAFQSPVLLPWKNTIENVLLPIRVRRKVSADDYRKAEELLDFVGLEKFKSRFPGELSGGMQQRAAICRALIQDPACLLLDEPFGALDALTRENINVFFNRLWNRTGTTIVLVTHSIQEAVFLSTRVLVMTARPGAIIDEIRIPLPPVREREMIGTPEFAELTSAIRRYFNEARND